MSGSESDDGESEPTSDFEDSPEGTLGLEKIMGNGGVAFAQDESARHDSTQLSAITLRESEEFNRSIVENSRDCIKLLGLDGTLLMMTEGGRKMLCIKDLSDFIGKSWIDFWEGEDW